MAAGNARRFSHRQAPEKPKKVYLVSFINYNRAMIDIKQTATFRTWERKLKDSRAKAAIAARIFRLANGLPGDVSPVGAGVSELRIHYGPGYRVYFQQRGTEIVILLCGGDKSSQVKDIETAKRLASEWRPQ